MSDKVIYNKTFLKDSDYKVLDINVPNCLSNINIDDIYLTDGSIINVNDISFKSLYNDIDNPLVIKKYNDKHQVYINPDYYLNNQDKIDEIICNYIKNYKLEKFTLSDSGLIKEKKIKSIINNPNIKEVCLGKYSKEGYILTVEDYKENEFNKKESRRLYSILINKYMVCVVFSRLFGDLLNKMGIENNDLSISIDTGYDKSRSLEMDFNDNRKKWLKNII